jgi:hypothetical protein
MRLFGEYVLLSYKEWCTLRPLKNKGFCKKCALTGRQDDRCAFTGWPRSRVCSYGMAGLKVCFDGRFDKETCSIDSGR